MLITAFNTVHRPMDLIFHPWNVRNCSPPLSFIERNFKLQLTKNTARIPPYPRSWKMSGWRTERVKGTEGGGGGAVEITLMVRVVLWRQGGRGESVSLVRSFGRGGARSSENRVPVNGEHLSSSSNTLNPLQHCKIWRQWKSSIRYTPLSKKYFRPIYPRANSLQILRLGSERAFVLDSLPRSWTTAGANRFLTMARDREFVTERPVNREKSVSKRRGIGMSVCTNVSLPPRGM